MRARAYEIEVRDVFAQIVRTHPGALHQRGLHAEGAAEMAAQRVAEMQRVDVVFRDDVARPVR